MIEMTETPTADSAEIARPMFSGVAPCWASDDGNVTLYHADCLDVLPLLSGIDCVCTDPPYGITLTNNDRDGHRRADGYEIESDQDQIAGGKVLDWSDGQQLPTIFFSSPWRPWPGDWRNLIVWDKAGAVGGGGDIKTCLKRTWELVQVKRNGKMNGRRAESVWRFPMTPQDTADHICAKPVALMSALITRFTAEGDTVLDCFMGSGSTGVACVKSGRKFIGIEVDARYFQIAKERIRKELQKGRLF